MKKSFLLVTLLIALFSGCSRKTQPARTVVKPAPTKTAPNQQEPPASVSMPPPVANDSIVLPAAPGVAFATPMIIIDGTGKVITSKDKLPGNIAAKANYALLSRSFTPDQRTNLIFRYKMVPPRVLYVPEQYISTSARGKYIVYRKKFWYWQKADGLFHLDDTYYN